MHLRSSEVSYRRSSDDTEKQNSSANMMIMLAVCKLYDIMIVLLSVAAVFISLTLKLLGLRDAGKEKRVIERLKECGNVTTYGGLDAWEKTLGKCWGKNG
jgi:hypothetical protein